MKVLMVYPAYPDTFWSFKYALKFISKKAAFPPLGLLTVASLLPKDWNIKLVDMNTDPLKDEDLIWADMVFISSMLVQRDSTMKFYKGLKNLIRLLLLVDLLLMLNRISIQKWTILF